MPNMVTVEVNPDFEHPHAADYKAAKAAGPKEVTYVTALENVKNSGGIYRIKKDKVPEAAIQSVALEDMDKESLKVMFVSLGIKTEKRMMKEDMIRLIRKRLEGIEVAED